MEKVLWLIEHVKSGLWSFVLESSRWTMASRLARPVEIDSDQIETLIKHNQHGTTWEIVNILKISKSIVIGENEKCVLYFTEKTKRTFWPTQYLAWLPRFPQSKLLSALTPVISASGPYSSLAQRVILSLEFRWQAEKALCTSQWPAFTPIPCLCAHPQQRGRLRTPFLQGRDQTESYGSFHPAPSTEPGTAHTLHACLVNK